MLGAGVELSRGFNNNKEHGCLFQKNSIFKHTHKFHFCLGPLIHGFTLTLNILFCPNIQYRTNFSEFGVADSLLKKKKKLYQESCISYPLLHYKLPKT